MSREDGIGAGEPGITACRKGGCRSALLTCGLLQRREASSSPTPPSTGAAGPRRPPRPAATLRAPQALPDCHPRGGAWRPARPTAAPGGGRSCPPGSLKRSASPHPPPAGGPVPPPAGALRSQAASPRIGPQPGPALGRGSWRPAARRPPAASTDHSSMQVRLAASDL